MPSPSQPSRHTSSTTTSPDHSSESLALPIELVDKVYSYVELQDRLKWAGVNKHFAKMVYDQLYDSLNLDLLNNASNVPRFLVRLDTTLQNRPELCGLISNVVIRYKDQTELIRYLGSILGQILEHGELKALKIASPTVPMSDHPIWTSVSTCISNRSWQCIKSLVSLNLTQATFSKTMLDLYNTADGLEEVVIGSINVFRSNQPVPLISPHNKLQSLYLVGFVSNLATAMINSGSKSLQKLAFSGILPPFSPNNVALSKLPRLSSLAFREKVDQAFAADVLKQVVAVNSLEFTDDLGAISPAMANILTSLPITQLEIIKPPFDPYSSTASTANPLSGPIAVYAHLRDVLGAGAFTKVTSLRLNSHVTFIQIAHTLPPSLQTLRISLKDKDQAGALWIFGTLKSGPFDDIPFTSSFEIIIEIVGTMRGTLNQQLLEAAARIKLGDGLRGNLVLHGQSHYFGKGQDGVVGRMNVVGHPSGLNQQ